MTTAAYTVPDNPAAPEHAALELIMRIPAEVLHTDSFREVLQDFCGVLHAEGAFAGMSWNDAKHAASAIMFDAINRDDAAAFLRWRAEQVCDGSDGITWDDPAAMVRALTIGVTVLGLWAGGDYNDGAGFSCAVRLANCYRRPNRRKNLSKPGFNLSLGQ